MQGASVLIVLGCCLGWASSAFLNHRPFPTYSLENMPDTDFTCREKILGGYYADADAQCQMFHVCVKVAGVGIQDFRFLCPNGTAFDQDHQICAEWEDVDCDATTLYYSSDNFDLYRIGSGFESKAVKYGEDEETFALQRAETGDARLNRDHQSNRVNQQKDNFKYNKAKVSSRPAQQSNNNNNNNNNNNERDIFKGSSSSNFFNNRNNGKETDEDYDDNVNVNQDNDYAQKRKIVRKQQRRPVQQQQNTDEEQEEQVPQQHKQKTHIRTRPANTERPQQRQTGFVNNFAGSSYIPTTSRPTTTTTEEPATTVAQRRVRTRQRVQQYNNADNFRQQPSSPQYTVSTPAPFKQTQQYNNPPVRQNNNNGQYYTTTPASKKQTTENYPQPINNNNYNPQYDIPKVKQTKQTENYPTTSNNNNQFVKSKATTEADNYPSNNPQNLNKKPTTPFKQPDNYPTTFSPKAKPFTVSGNSQNNFPTTFAPRTNAAYTQITAQTVNYKNNDANNNNNQQYNNQLAQKSTTQFNNQFSQNFAQKSTTQQQNNGQYNQQQQQQKSTTQYNNFNNQNQRSTASQSSQTPFAKQFTNQPNSTPRTTAFTQYTPTVPKISSTTPVARSNRFDETSYDDGSYSTKYDYDGDKKDDEFLKTAHSQNIASSRNELAKSAKNTPQTTQKPYYESPRPFSVTANTPRAQTTNYKQIPQVATKNTAAPKEEQKRPAAPQSPPKKVKDISYDYAYYDSNASSGEPEYEIDTEFKKSTVKN